MTGCAVVGTNHVPGPHGTHCFAVSCRAKAASCIFPLWELQPQAEQELLEMAISNAPGWDYRRSNWRTGGLARAARGHAAEMAA